MTCLYLLGSKERGLLKYGISSNFAARSSTHRIYGGLGHVIRKLDRDDAGFVEWCMHQLTRHMRVREREYLAYRPRVVSRIMDSLCLLSDAQDIWPLIRLGGAMPDVVLKRCHKWDVAEPAVVHEAALAGARATVLKSAAAAGWDLSHIIHPDMDGWDINAAYKKLGKRGTAVREE